MASDGMSRIYNSGRASVGNHHWQDWASRPTVSQLIQRPSAMENLSCNAQFLHVQVLHMLLGSGSVVATICIDFKTAERPKGNTPFAVTDGH